MGLGCELRGFQVAEGIVGIAAFALVEVLFFNEVAAGFDFAGGEDAGVVGCTVHGGAAFNGVQVEGDVGQAVTEVVDGLNGDAAVEAGTADTQDVRTVEGEAGQLEGLGDVMRPGSSVVSNL